MRLASDEASHTDSHGFGTRIRGWSLMVAQGSAFLYICCNSIALRSNEVHVSGNASWRDITGAMSFTPSQLHREAEVMKAILQSNLLLRCVIQYSTASD